ncbi:MAG TPA: amidohydrolase [Acidimicrobiia bacterium]|nr:amidohydrolase [Acidimicrobiia bacterium]
MKADLVIRGGRVFTADPSRVFVEAVAVVGDRIAAVGRDAESVSAGDVIDLDGALATPGFIDAHVHPASSGLDKLRCHFDEAHDISSALDAVAAYAAANPDLPWIVGAGWPQSWFPDGCPSKDVLDGAVANRPVLLTNTDGHGAWANSKALELAGIGPGTPDPPDGRIERLPDGSPQGTLHEGAIRLVESHAPADTVDDLTAGLAKGQEELLSCGITGWQDAIVDEKIQEAYLGLAGARRLKGSVVGALWWDRNRGVEQIPELVARRERSAEGFRPIAVKLMLDGVVENFTASMLQPYRDERGSVTDNRGIDFVDPEDLKDIVVTLDHHGFQCHFHAIGDRAVRSALDAVEAARRRNGPSSHRHHIAHIQVIHPDDLRRFAALDVIANAQPLWAHNDEYQTELTKPFLGAERSGWQYPFRSLLDGGARMGMGSDWGVSTANVMEEIHVAVTRTWDEDEEPLCPEQALTPVEALHAFTAGSAYINHTETETGTVSVGKLADFAVLDRDPLEEGPFREAKVVTTVIGGEVVYEGS